MPGHQNDDLRNEVEAIDPMVHERKMALQKYFARPGYSTRGVAAYWTLEEANALLHNLSPSKVTWAIVEKDLASTGENPIIERYLQLRALLCRAVAVGELKCLEPIPIPIPIPIPMRGAYAGEREFMANIKLVPLDCINWAQSITLQPPEELVRVVTKKAKQPSYADLVKRNSELEALGADNDPIREESKDIDPRERKSLLVTIAGLSMVAARLHIDCRTSGGNPNMSGVIRQIHEDVSSTIPGMSTKRLEERLRESMETLKAAGKS